MLKHFDGGTKAFLTAWHLWGRWTYSHSAAAAYEEVKHRKMEMEAEDLTDFIKKADAIMRSVVEAGGAAPSDLQPQESQSMYVAVECHLGVAQAALERLGPGLAPLEVAISLLDAAERRADGIPAYVCLFLVHVVERTQHRFLDTAKEGARPPAAPLCYLRVLHVLRQALLPFSYTDMARFCQLDLSPSNLKDFDAVSAGFFSLYENMVTDADARIREGVDREILREAESSSGSEDSDQVGGHGLDPPGGPELCICSNRAKASQEESRKASTMWRRRQCPNVPSPLREAWTPDDGLAVQEEE